MCVIILKKPGIMIDKDKIEAACDVNPNGFGVAILNDDKSLLMQRSYNPKGNDYKELYDLIEKHKDQQQYIHLRYSTLGAKNLDNCHPFTMCHDKDTGFEVQLMHNGTLNYPGLVVPAGISDTRAFAEGHGKFFTELMYEKYGPDVLNVPEYKVLIDRFLDDKWYFLTYDNLGNYNIQGKDKGTWHNDGAWWSSNTYSFNSRHRESYSYNNYRDNYKNIWPSDSTTKASSTSNVTDITTEAKKSNVPFRTETKPNPTARDTAVVKSLGYALREAHKKGLKECDFTPPDSRPTFMELAGIDSLDPCMVLTEDDIQDMIEENPYIATILIMDLLYERYDQKLKAKVKAA